MCKLREMSYVKAIFLIAMFVSMISCSVSTENSEKKDVDLTPSEPPSKLALSPTRTPSPTFTPPPTAIPSPTPDIEDIYSDIPDCIQDDSADQVVFHELLDKILVDIEQQENLHYSTLYRYKENDLYPDDELSIFLEANHNKPITEPGGGKLYFYPMTSHLYENSHIQQTNLRTGDQSEFIITNKGFWFRGSENESWLFFDGFVQGDMLNSAEMFSPGWIGFLLGGGGSLTPGIWSEQPEMVVEEQIHGEQVLHRCWLLSERSDDIDGYLIHFDSIYTFLDDTQVHLWTADNDQRLVRLVITGKHDAERLGENEFADHEQVRDFLLWMDVYSEDIPDVIQEPNPDEFVTISSQVDLPVSDIQASYDEFPLPPGAISSDFGIFAREGNTPVIPREYLWPHYESTQSALDQFAGPNWYDIPSERIPMYKVDSQLSDVFIFYLSEMEQLGWSIEDILYQPGWSRLYIHFKRDQVSQVTILEEHEDGTTNITGILPPEDEILASIIAGWEAYDEENSALINNTVKAITFDQYGNAWIGSETSDKWFSLSSDGTTD